MGHVHGRLIAFDLDGTLVDSRRDLADSANELIRELGGVPLAEGAVGQMVGEGVAVLVSRVLQASGLGDRTAASDHDRALERFLEIYDTRLLRHTVPYPGIAAAIEVARAGARVAVLTNKIAGATERILAGLGLRDLVDDVVGGDGPWPRKPDPASLFALMARAGASPDRTLVVGDSRIDVETARAGGVAICIARYGFGFESRAVDDLRESERVVDSPAELVGVLRRFLA